MKTTRNLTVVGCLWLGVAVEAWAQGGFFSELQAVSVAAPGLASAVGNGLSGASVVSADGRFVAFVSQTDNLLSNDLSRSALGSYLDVFVRELATGKTTLVSVTPDGATSGNGHSTTPSFSVDGRYVAFESAASNLIANDANDASDVFVRDLQTGTTVLVSANPAGAPGHGASTNPTLTPDGRSVVFESAASDLAAGDANDLSDVFVRDLQTGVTTLVSAGAAGEPGLDGSHSPVITPDGRYVAFESTATNLVSEAPASAGQVYLRDLISQTTKWVGGTAAGAYLSFTNVVLTNLSSGSLVYFTSNAVLSDDGRYVAFKAAGFSLPTLVLRHDTQTGATELISRAGAAASPNIADESGPKMSADGRMIAYAGALTQIDQADVSVWDGQSKSSTLVSVNLAATGAAKGIADTPAISADGRLVAFLSDATDLVANPTDGSFQVYVRDLVNGTTRIVSAKPDGSAGGSCEGAAPTLSADGRVIAFESFDGGLVAHDENSLDDVFAFDLTRGAVALVSEVASGLASETASGESFAGANSLSADGRYVVFTSWAEDLVANDANDFPDVFVRDTVNGTTTLVSVTAAGTSGNGQSRDSAISGDGRYVVFVSGASDLVAKDTNTKDDVFARDLQTGTTALVSVKPDGSDSGNGASGLASVSADGKAVCFQSLATDLVAGISDPNNANDVFLRDLITGSTKLVSVAQSGASAGNRESSLPLVSPDGHYVAFSSSASDLVGGGLLGSARLFLRDVATQKTTLLPPDENRGQGLFAFSADSRWLVYQPSTLSRVFAADLVAQTNLLVCTNCTRPSVSADGRYVAYERSIRFPAPVPQYVEVFDRERGVSFPVSLSLTGTGFGNGKSSSPVISADGRFVLFESRASDLVPDDTNGWTDVFASDLVSGITVMLSRSRLTGSVSSSVSVNPFIGPDSRTVIFDSFSEDLAAGDANEHRDVFLLRLNAADSDGDTLPDDWEWFHFGGLGQSSAADADGDGLDNAGEFRAGTNPASAGSAFRAVLVVGADGSKLVSWPQTLGRTYQMQYKNSLNDLQWLPVTGSFGMIGGVSGFLDSTAAQAGERFYRVVILP